MNKNNFLEGKNILITGASSGIGRTLTKNLSKFGANIIMLSKNEKKLDSIYDEIKEKYKTDPCILKCDLIDLDENKSKEIANVILENYKNLDAIIHNAAILEKISNIENFSESLIYLNKNPKEINSSKLSEKEIIPSSG